MNKFWSKVDDCEHKNLTDHNPVVTCGTDYCSADEAHCGDCGVYIGTCGCGASQGMSGWSAVRWNKHYWNKRKKVQHA